MTILGLLPLLTLIALIITLGNIRLEWSWSRVFLRSVILLGVYLVFVTELLSLFWGLTQLGLFLTWIIPTLALGTWVILHLRQAKGLRWPSLHFPTDLESRLMLGSILIIVCTTGLIAWLSPPNTWDSLSYHMSRVAHWAQENSVRPFATGILRQQYMSPGAEFIILHTYILSAGDRWANFIQWFAMVASLIGVYRVAIDLGAKPKGALFASLFTATLPMGIAQSSSTMTDYVAALWVLCVAAETVLLLRGEDKRAAIVFISLAAGLAGFTKPTTAPFLIPFAILVLILLFKSFRVREVIAFGIFAILAVLLINLGYFARNWLIFGNLLGGGSHVSVFINEFINWRVVLSNILRNASLHAGTPFTRLNDLLYLAFAKLHWKLDLPLTDPRTSIHPLFKIWEYLPDEARAGNTLQAILCVVVFCLLLLKPKQYGSKTMTLALSAIAGFILYAVIFKFDLLASRYHMPFFVLMAPIVGLVIDQIPGSLGIGAFSLILVLGCLPVLFGLNSRSLIKKAEEASILGKTRTELHFTQAPHLDEPYIEMTELIEEAGCIDIGIMLSGDAAEYPLWILLETQSGERTIEWVISRSDPTGVFRKSEFKPCALICGRCPLEWTSFNDLPLVYDDYGFRLFLRNLEVPVSDGD